MTVWEKAVRAATVSPREAHSRKRFMKQNRQRVGGAGGRHNTRDSDAPPEILDIAASAK